MPRDLPRTFRGASQCVRDTARVAISPIHASANNSKDSYFPAVLSNIFPPSPPITPSSSPSENSSIQPFAAGKAILTPNSSTDSLSLLCYEPAASFLEPVFPEGDVSRSAIPVPSTRPRGWQLAVYDSAKLGTRTLYAKPAPSTVASEDNGGVDLRDNIVRLLEKADEEQLDCDAMVVILDKAHPHLANIIHSLLYVGGSIVLRPALPELEHSNDYVLVGIDI